MKERPRHTRMEVDAVHGVLEAYFKLPLNSPMDYVARMRAARPSQPFYVHVVDYTFFKNFEAVSVIHSSREKTGNPTVTDLRQLKYDENGIIHQDLRLSRRLEAISPKEKIAGVQCSTCAIPESVTHIEIQIKRNLQTSWTSSGTKN